MLAQERRLAAIAAASAAAFRRNDYHQVRAEDVAERVRLPRGADQDSGRSAVWLYNEVRSRRVLVALAVKHAFDEFTADEPPPPATAAMLDAQAVVTSALRRIARFHQLERFMLTQVRLGIGDISTSEKRPSAAQTPPGWQPGTFGRAAAAGWEGRITAYAEYLAPRLRQAALTVTVPPQDWAVTSAERLSELAFRAMVDDQDGPVDHQAKALAAYWMARDLVPLAGEWADRLHTAERAAELTHRVAGDRRARTRALAVVFHVLLDETPLLARGAQVGGELDGLLAARPGDARDARARFDVTSRRGLALLRLGDTGAARACFEASQEIAGELPEETREAYLTRAEHNLAEVLVEEGRPAAGRARLLTVAEKRAAGVATTGLSAGWRRLTLTRQALAAASTKSGRVVEGVVRAEEVVADREERLGPDNVNTASARVTLAEALLAAGHPAQARHQLTEAMRLRALHLPTDGYWPQYDLVRLAEIELSAGFPAQAVRLLADSVVVGDWFAERVSPRLRQEALLLRARALVADGDVPAALEELELLPPDRAARRVRAGALLALGDAEAAARLLETIAATEHDLDDDHPGQAATLLLAARAAIALGEEVAAESAAAALAALGKEAMDPTHPLLLAGRLDSALHRARTGHAGEVRELLAPLLDRKALPHRKPALGDGHPLLAEALALATRVGDPPSTLPEDRLWEDL
ncbi:tetratricopeptide repeat protein [Acrocarpospora catenulata]|uniref:tetratricopeptide repeat protein n=1 Tax=Acrocarpospora catenulata TaxID=2836182 RepID=UPI001BD9C2AF|nr:tetratricopeptide repeat protein [Acrocarpospora catenulata]